MSNNEMFFLSNSFEVAELAQTRVYRTNTLAPTLMLAEFFHSRAQPSGRRATSTQDRLPTLRTFAATTSRIQN